MNEIYLDANSGGNLTPRRLEQEVPPQKSSKNQSAQDVSFREVLTSVADKAKGLPEIRQDLVDKYKHSLANGTYEVKAHELAEKMIQKIRENKTRELL